VKNSFDLLLLDHSLEVLSTVLTARNLLWKRRIIKPISIHSRSYGRFCSLCFIYMCILCKI